VREPDPYVHQVALVALEALVQRAEDQEVQHLAAEVLGIPLEPVTADAVSETMTDDPDK
jgi:hypothetical protein